MFENSLIPLKKLRIKYVPQISLTLALVVIIVAVVVYNNSGNNPPAAIQTITQSKSISPEMQAYACAKNKIYEMTKSSKIPSPSISPFNEARIEYMPSNSSWRVLGQVNAGNLLVFGCASETLGTQMDGSGGDRSTVECSSTKCFVSSPQP